MIDHPLQRILNRIDIAVMHAEDAGDSPERIDAALTEYQARFRKDRGLQVPVVLVPLRGEIS